MCGGSKAWAPSPGHAGGKKRIAPFGCPVRMRESCCWENPPAHPGNASGLEWNLEDWRLADIQAELPWVGEKTSGRFLAHSLNLDLSGAVSFTKGCFVGQEIIARMEYRGTPKRRMQRVRLPEGLAVEAGQRPGPFRGMGRPPSSPGRLPGEASRRWRKCGLRGTARNTGRKNEIRSGPDQQHTDERLPGAGRDRVPGDQHAGRLRRAGDVFRSAFRGGGLGGQRHHNRAAALGPAPSAWRWVRCSSRRCPTCSAGAA